MLVKLQESNSGEIRQNMWRKRGGVGT